MIQCFGTIKDGKLIIQNRPRLDADIKNAKDCAIQLTIKKTARRSLPQNAYLWGVVYKEIEIRLRELGNDVNTEVVHEFLKYKFNEQYIHGDGGEVLGVKPGSTTDMTKDEFGNYIDKIIEWAASFLSITIPLPNENLTFQF